MIILYHPPKINGKQLYAAKRQYNPRFRKRRTWDSRLKILKLMRQGVLKRW